MCSPTLGVADGGGVGVADRVPDKGNPVGLDVRAGVSHEGVVASSLHGLAVGVAHGSLESRASGGRVAQRVALGVSVAFARLVRRGVSSGSRVGVCVAVADSVRVGEAVCVGVCVAVADGVVVGEGVGVKRLVRLGTADGLGEGVSDMLGVTRGVEVSVRLAATVGVLRTCVAVAVAVAVITGAADRFPSV